MQSAASSIPKVSLKGEGCGKGKKKKCLKTVLPFGICFSLDSAFF
jgi:hypothetical protein